MKRIKLFYSIRMLGLIFAFLSLVLPSVFGQEYERLSLNEASATHIIFAARAPTIFPLSPGHAFASLAIQDSQKTCIVNAYGFYPCENCNVLLNQAQGRVVLGFEKNSRKRALSTLAFKVDSQNIPETQVVLKKWENMEYNLFSRNCVKFISEVAEAQGFEVPKTRILGFFPKFPKQFIRQLNRKNKLRNAQFQFVDEKGIPACKEKEREKTLAFLD